MTEPELFSEPYEGSESGPLPAPETKTSDHKHVWDILPDVLDRPAIWEFCMICREKRRIQKNTEAVIFKPPIRCKKTGY